MPRLNEPCTYAALTGQERATLDALLMMPPDKGGVGAGAVADRAGAGVWPSYLGNLSIRGA